MNKELTIEINDPTEVFSTQGGLDPVIEEVRKIIAEFEPDISTTKGRQEIASMAHKVAKLKTRLDGMGKELTADWKAKAKLVDQSRRYMRDELDALKAQVRKPLTEWEEADVRRVAEHEAVIDRIKALGTEPEDGSRRTLEQLQADLEELEGIDTDPLEEYELEGRKTRDKVIARLKNQIGEEQKRKEQEEELKRLQQEKAERERKDAEDRMKQEAAEQAKREAEEKAQAEKEKAERKAREEQERLEREKQEAIEREQRAKEEVERAERERIAAEERAKLEKEQAEREKQEAIKRAKQEEIERQQAEKAQEEAERKKREANTRHKGKIHSEAKEALISAVGIDEGTAKAIVHAIVKNNIPHVSIRY